MGLAIFPLSDTPWDWSHNNSGKRRKNVPRRNIPGLPQWKQCFWSGQREGWRQRTCGLLPFFAGSSSHSAGSADAGSAWDLGSACGRGLPGTGTGIRRESIRQ